MPPTASGQAASPVLVDSAPARPPEASVSAEVAPPAVAESRPPAGSAPQPATSLDAVSSAPIAGAEPAPMAVVGEAAVEPGRTTCTTAQLRRFIKSRPWVPMHELRRRFGIWGADDDVSPMRVGGHTLFIGLPPAEGRMMEELLAGGDVGYELSLDPETPVVVGVYPMRPVPRS